MMKNIAGCALLLVVAVLPSACSFVDPTASGGVVRVAYDGDIAGCRDAGSVAVSVTDKIAFYHRSDLKVRDELETLARNEAANIPADTIKPLNEPKDGAQRFEAYVCGRVQVKQRGAARNNPPMQPADPDAVQTFPAKEH